MTARGRIQLAPGALRMVGVKGGQFNNTLYLDGKWGQVSADVELAVRGWNIGGPEDRFTIALDAQAGGRTLFQMRDSRGMFTWIKRA